MLIFKYNNKILKFIPKTFNDIQNMINSLPTGIPYKILEDYTENINQNDLEILLSTPDGYTGIK